MPVPVPVPVPDPVPPAETVVHLPGPGEWRQTIPLRSIPVGEISAVLQAAGAQVSLSPCASPPSAHIDCVLSCWNFMLQKFASQARD